MNISNETYPMNNGYSIGLNMSLNDSTWFTIIALFANFIAILFALDRQSESMACSGFLPDLMKVLKIEGEQRFNVYSIIGSIAGLLLTLLTWLIDPAYYIIMSNVALLGGFFVYLSVFLSYMVFHRRYHSFERKFRSPFGLTGSVLGMIMMLANVAALVGFTPGYDSYVGFIVYMVLSTIYYILYARSHQKFSKQEEKVLLVGYIVNNNTNRNKNLKNKKLSRAKVMKNLQRQSPKSTSSHSSSLNKAKVAIDEGNSNSVDEGVNKDIRVKPKPASIKEETNEHDADEEAKTVLGNHLRTEGTSSNVEITMSSNAANGTIDDQLDNSGIIKMHSAEENTAPLREQGSMRFLAVEISQVAQSVLQPIRKSMIATTHEVIESAKHILHDQLFYTYVAQTAENLSTDEKENDLNDNAILSDDGDEADLAQEKID